VSILTEGQLATKVLEETSADNNNKKKIKKNFDGKKHLLNDLVAHTPQRETK
jgi:hypothetical protein